MRKSITGLSLLAVAVLTGVTYALLSQGGTASAAGTVIGYDMDPAGNTATALGPTDRCRSANPGEQFVVDVFLDEIPAGTDFGGFNYTIGFDDTRIRLVLQEHDLILASAAGSTLFDLSDGVPDGTTPHTVAVADFGTAEAGPIKGVLGRYTFEALLGAPTGTFAMTLAAPGLSDSIGTDLTVDGVKDANSIPQFGLVAISQTCPASGADLSIVKTDAVDPMQAGQTLTYLLAVANNGPFDATNVSVTDALPPEVTFVSSTSSRGSCGHSAGTVTCNLGNMLLGDTASISINATVLPGASGAVNNTASVTSSTSDPVLTNNSDGETTLVGSVADLSVAITDAPDPVLIGSPVTYTLTVFNSGPSTATGVALTDTLPGQLTYLNSSPSQGSCSHSAGVVACPLGTLAPNTSATVQITANATTSLSEVVTNTATVSSPVQDPNTANNTDAENTFVRNGDIVTVVGVDGDPSTSPANTATSLGTVQTCRTVNRGQSFDVDVFVNEVPAGRELAGFSYELHFDPSRATIAAQNTDLLLGSAAGSNPFDLGSSAPNSVSPHIAGTLDLGTAEVGPVVGVLARYTMTVPALAPDGLFTISLAQVDLADLNAETISVDQVQVATFAVSVACPVDTDGDGVPDPTDNCPSVFNPSQFDADGDLVGDDCDPDKDNDGVPNLNDNCPTAANAGQEDFNADGQGDVCDDTDGDGIVDATDNCVFVPNPTQIDTDGDTRGNACDSDRDGDGVANVVDNCPDTMNAGQADLDNDGIGDVCEDSDGDGIVDATDNCPLTSNLDQADLDNNGIGDVCDPDIDGDSVLNGADQCLLVREDLDGNDDPDGCPDVDSGLTITGNHPQAVGISIANPFAIQALVTNGNVIANASLSLVLTSTAGQCEARWVAQPADGYSEVSAGTLTSTLTVAVTAMTAAEVRNIAREYEIVCAGPGLFSIDLDGDVAPVAPVLEESSGVAPNSHAETISFTAFEASDIEIVSFTGPDDLPAASGNQLLVGQGSPETVTLPSVLRNNGPFTPTSVVALDSVQDVDADGNSTTDCSVTPHDTSSAVSLPVSSSVNSDRQFDVTWDDVSPPPTWCRMSFRKAVQVTTPTARDLNAVEILLNDVSSDVRLVGLGSASASWTNTDSSTGSSSVVLSYATGSSNGAQARAAAGLPLNSILDLSFDYHHVSGGVDGSITLTPYALLRVDCTNDGTVDHSVINLGAAVGDGQALVNPGWYRLDTVDSAHDLWYVPGIVSEGSPVTLQNAVSALVAGDPNCQNTDPIVDVTLEYGEEATATGGTARVDNLVVTGAELATFELDLVLDSDNDGIANGYQTTVDNCPSISNPGQVDQDNDGLGDACDTDRDGDTVPDAIDNCPDAPNSGQADFNSNNIGDACDDADGDTVLDANDNCRTVPNTNQLNTDGDSEGDACDADDDNDLIVDGADACPVVAEDIDLVADADGCPDTDVSLSVVKENPASMDVNVSDLFTVDATVTNGNYVSDITLEMEVRSTVGQCQAHWVTQAGDSFAESIIDNADPVPDTLVSTLSRLLINQPAAGQTIVSRDYQLICESRGSRQVTLDLAVTPSAPVVEENVSNNSHNQNVTFSVYDVTDIQAVSLAATDGLASIAGAQILVGPLPPVVGSSSPMAFNLSQSVRNNGPFGPVSVNSATTVLDVDADNDNNVDCDLQPNAQGNTLNIASGATFTGPEGYTVTWLDNAAPPYFCTVLFQKGTSITTPFVRDTNSANNGIALQLDLVRDTDFDTVPDSYQTLADNCPTAANTSQLNTDGDLLGDACDPDIDGDGILNGTDNCPTVSNPSQADLDGDLIGDACDNDRDNDGVPNAVDNCPDNSNPLQNDVDFDGIGDACDDGDLDGVPDATDNCIAVSNPSQSNIDGDAFGDACDSDRDGDGRVNSLDNCPNTPNPGQENADADSQGDVCDDDDDNDTIVDASDACVTVAEDLDGTDDLDGCPDTNASTSLAGTFAPVVDLNVGGIFPINATVNNGNKAATINFTLTLVSDPRYCSVHLVAQGGDNFNEFAEDTDADLINDRFTSSIQKSMVMGISQSTVVARDYLVTCTQNALHTLQLTAVVAPVAPVLEENAANNTATQAISLSAYAVADVSTNSFAAPDDWAAVPAVGAAETNCTNSFDDDADLVINDGCPGLTGNQVLVQAGAPPHAKYPSGVPSATRNFSLTHGIHNAGPQSPAGVTATYSLADLDGDGNTTVDCDSTPNSQDVNTSIGAGSTTTSGPSIGTNWVTASAPPQFCTGAIQASLAFTAAYVRDPNTGNDNASVSVDFVRDADGDGVPDDYQGIVDNCPTVPNPDQISTMVVGLGDACDPDEDFDMVDDNFDNCLGLFNPDQANSDPDPLGNACDPDDDNDGICDVGGPLPDGTPGTILSGCAAGASGADNCRTVVNPGQDNSDTDVLGDLCDPDDDNDFYGDAAEQRLGSNMNAAPSTPEACDGVDNDGDGSVDEGFDVNNNGVRDCIDPGLDTDGDGANNAVDTDDDNDGFSDALETYLRTNPLISCSNSPDVLPTDITGDGFILLNDVLRFNESFGAQEGDPTFIRRLDLTGNGFIQLADILRLSSGFGTHC